MFVPISVMIPRYLVVVNLALTTPFFTSFLCWSPVGLFLVKQFIDKFPTVF